MSRESEKSQLLARLRKKAGKVPIATPNVDSKNVAALKGEPLKKELELIASLQKTPDFLSLIYKIVLGKLGNIAKEVKDGQDVVNDLEILFDCGIKIPRIITISKSKSDTLGNLFSGSFSADEQISNENFSSAYHAICKYTAIQLLIEKGYCDNELKLKQEILVKNIIDEFRDERDVFTFFSSANFPRTWCQGKNTPLEEFQLALHTTPFCITKEEAAAFNIPTNLETYLGKIDWSLISKLSKSSQEETVKILVALFPEVVPDTLLAQIFESTGITITSNGEGYELNVPKDEMQAIGANNGADAGPA